MPIKIAIKYIQPLPTYPCSLLSLQGMKSTASHASIEELKAQLAASRAMSGSFGSPASSTHATSPRESSIPNPFQATPSQTAQLMGMKMPFGGSTVPLRTTNGLNAINNNNNNINTAIITNQSPTLLNSNSQQQRQSAQIVNGFLQRDRLVPDLGDLLNGNYH